MVMIDDNRLDKGGFTDKLLTDVLCFTGQLEGNIF